MLWIDEFFSWNLLIDPSWKHAVTSWRAGVDSGGPLFYVFGRLMSGLLGPNPVWFRMVSALCFWLAGLIWFLLLRRRFSSFSAAFSVGIVWCGAPLILTLCADVRFYGLFFLTFSISAALIVCMQSVEWSFGTCFLAVFLASSSLVLTHTIGFVYSLGLALIALISPGLHKRRVLVCLGFAASWCTLIPFLPTLKKTADLVQWIPRPDLPNFIRYHLHHPLGTPAENITLALSLLIGLSVWALRFAKTPTSAHTADVTALIGIFLLLVPTAFAVESLVGRPIVAERYMLPYALGWAIFLAAAIRSLERMCAGRVRLLTILAAVLGVFLIAAHVSALRLIPRRPKTLVEQVARVPGRLPVVMTDPNAFMQVQFYFPETSSRLRLLVPRTELIDPTASLHGIAIRAGYLHGVVQENDLGRIGGFLLLDSTVGMAETRRLAEVLPGWAQSAPSIVLLSGEEARLTKFDFRPAKPAR